MRNHDITEQQMRLERTASLMLKEAVSFTKGKCLIFCKGDRKLWALGIECFSPVTIAVS